MKKLFSRILLSALLLLLILALVLRAILLEKIDRFEIVAYYPSGLQFGVPTLFIVLVLVGLVLCEFTPHGFWPNKSGAASARLKQIVFGILFFVSAILVLFSSVSVKKIDRSGLMEISLEKFETLTQADEETIIYVGRPSCNACMEAYHSLLTYLDTDTAQNVYYYNTTEDRVNRKTELNAFLDSIPIRSVPALVLIQDGSITNIYYGGQVVDFIVEKWG